MARPTKAGDAERGFAYMALLLVVVVMGLAMTATSTVWQELQKRDKESELLFVGLQYRRAILQYYENSPGANAYPPSLDALLLDPRVPGIRRYLRRPFRDPMTNSANWGLVQAPQGGIMGVYSLAEGKPIKQANYPGELGWAEGKSSYAQWQFVYVPPNGTAGFGTR